MQKICVEGLPCVDTLLGAVGTRMTKEDTAPALTIQQSQAVMQNCCVTRAGRGRSKCSGAQSRSNYSIHTLLVVHVKFYTS